MMNLPFTSAQFFEVFAHYNEAVWPVHILLYALALAVIVLALVVPARAGRAAAFVLAYLWAWVALVYQLGFFWQINPAAPGFAALSLLAMVGFLWAGSGKGRLRFVAGWSARKGGGLALAVFALAGYPLVGILFGHVYPAAPSFGLPCPTTLFTFGVLLMAAPGFPRVLVLAPLTWAIIGSSAALSLGWSKTSAWCCRFPSGAIC